ncbi:HEAT repeat domain-containing protein [Acidithiobacillus caldus]|uniref:HEAT repeat domain-containing protein n=1 Tax=Acidithiobacillus caldus TaxID=33059 RepID=UPI001C06C9CD|nr:HEAT repeat domain-containing protein [Acidithiobacillus caldus]MBU2762233.1 HEAT repeat domain-containing protein [Acidithiobacillus caldus]MBU2770495.1 HEAT repeat domain-containing protein [Acidithiobacillus caldus]
MNHHYCPLCYAEIPIGSQSCPACGRDIEAWERDTPYFDRLIWALRNPHPEVRMGAILSLQNHQRDAAAVPLARCALAAPIDVIQGLAVVQAITRLPAGEQQRQALTLLNEHPAHSVRVAATAALHAEGTTSSLP